MEHLFNAGFPEAIFKEFETHTFGELSDNNSSRVSIFAQSKEVVLETGTSSQITEEIRDPQKCFLLAYCSLLSKQSDDIYQIKRADFLRSVGITPDNDNSFSLLDEESFESKKMELNVSDFELFAAALSFLDMLKAINDLNFSSAYGDITTGYKRAVAANNVPFKVLFNVFRGWLERYWELDEEANESFHRASVDAESSGNGLPAFFVDLVNLSSSLMDDEGADKMARFYLNELQWLLGLKHSVAESRTRDFYDSIFGTSQNKSSMEFLLESSDMSSNWYKAYSNLSPNQKLCVDIRKGRSLSLDGLNDDTFILAPDKIVEQYRHSGSFQHLSILHCFDYFLRHTRSRIDVKIFAPILADWIEDSADKVYELIGLICDKGSIVSRCLNLWKILQVSIQKGISAIHSTDIALAIYRNVASNDIPADIYMNVVSEVSRNIYGITASKVHKLEAVLRTGLETVAAYSLFDNDSIASVLTDLFIRDPESLLKQISELGENNTIARLQEKEKDALRIMLEGIDNKANVEVVGKYLWRLSEGEEECYIFVFNKLGIWNVESERKVNAWCCEETNETVYPINIIENWKNENDKKDARFVIVLMSGVSILRTELLSQILPNRVFLVSLNYIVRLFEPDSGNNSFRDPVHTLLKEEIDDSGIYGMTVSGVEWNLVHLIRAFKGCYSPDGHNYIIKDCSEDSIFYRFALVQILWEYLALNQNYWGNDIIFDAQFCFLPYKLSIQAKFDGPFSLQVKSFTFTDNSNYVSGTYSSVTGVCDDVLRQRLLIGGKDCLNGDYKEFLKKYESNFKEWREQLVIQNAIFEISKVLADKVAKNAIMTRNISHNLGSHVMAYLKYHLNTMEEMLKNNVFDYLFSSLGDYDRFCQDPQKWIESKKEELGGEKPLDIANVTLPFLVGLGKFISYIQERQDFIATIATDYHPGYIQLNFKDYIYDELNPDKRSLRHSERSGEVPDNILLGNIARSENLYREHCRHGSSSQEGHDIVLKFRSFNGDKPSPESQQERDLNEMRKYMLNIPGGTTGRHAIFSIIENVIRNAAKHGSRSAGSSLKLTFDIYSLTDWEKRAPTDDAVEGELSLSEVLKRFYMNCQTSHEYYFITLTDNQQTSYSQLQGIRKGLVDPYTKDGMMCEGYKGFKEMRICSSYLMNSGYQEYYAIPIEEDGSAMLDDDGNIPHDREWQTESVPVPPTYYARLSKDPGTNSKTGFLQYIFPVRRQMDVLIVSDRQLLDNESLKELEKCNWSLMSVSEFELEKVGGRYSFFLLDDAEDRALYERLRPLSNFYMISASSLGIDLKDVLTDFLSGKKEILEGLKEKILWQYSGYSDGDYIVIKDDRAEPNVKKFADTEVIFPNGEVGKLSKLIQMAGPSNLHRNYMFSTHYETKENFFRYLFILEHKHRKKPIFVEGISGANSTDRLIRCDNLDFEWFCRNLHAIKLRVGIFDERLAGSILRGMSPDNLKTDDHKGIVYADKNVWIYNIIDNGPDGFIVLGVSPEKTMTGNGNDKVTECRIIASIRQDSEGNVQIEFSNDCCFVPFDRLSIHQGLLDKIYDKFGIRDNVEKKEEFTKLFYEKFCSGSVIGPIASDNSVMEHYYLPGLSIHSGRSKPNSHDMPQHVPFVVFSLLEHAVLDCKYELVQLLDSIAYE